MSGYTPLFSSLTTGTLCGRWPDIGLWPIVLSLSDKNGIVDVTPAYIAGVTGLPVQEVVACMKRFCEPDQYSRSATDGGARLVLLDDHRDWGWRIVNHGKYREKARKAAYDSERTASGADAARKQRERQQSRDVPRCPDESRAIPLSDSDTNKDKEAAAAPPVDGLDLEAWNRWESYRREIRKPIKPASVLAAQRKLAGFGTSQHATVENSIAEGYTGLFPPKDAQKPKQRGVVV